MILIVWRQEEQEFKSILGYTVSLRSACVIRDATNKKEKINSAFTSHLLNTVSVSGAGLNGVARVYSGYIQLCLFRL